MTALEWALLDLTTRPWQNEFRRCHMAESYLTMAEIEAKYPNELVLLGNPTTRRGSLAPTGGCVILHATNRAEFDRQFEEWPGDPSIKHLASWYTGEAQGLEMLPADAAPEPGAA